jgi:hypothetical protein
MTERSGLPTTRPLPHDLTFFGSTAVLDGEDAAGYEGLLARISDTLQPADILEEIWVRDVAAQGAADEGSHVRRREKGA